MHYYQPLWTLGGGGGGRASVGQSARAQLAVMPRGATWIKEAAAGIDPDNQCVELASGAGGGL